MVARKEARLSPDDLVYKTSRWTRWLYGEERRHNQGIQQAEQAGLDRNERFPDASRELFSRLYQPKTAKLEEPTQGAEWAEKLHSLCEESPEFKILQNRCAGDEVWAGMATAALGKSVVAKMKAQPPKHDLEKQQQRVDGLRKLKQEGASVDRKLEAAEKNLAEAKEEAEAIAQGMDPVAIRQAIRSACEKAQSEINEAEQEMQAFSYGRTPGEPMARGNADEKRKLAGKIKDNAKLKRIAQLAGRMRRVAAEKQRSKTDDARSEVSNIEQGDALDRLLPNEYMDLIDPQREAVFFARLLDKRCLQYKLSGKERVGRGPIVICCDESGSMRGEPDNWAKAVSLALLDVAQRQKRSWAYVHFDSHVSRVDKVKAGAVDPDALMQCMEWFTSGGTSFEPPLDEAVKLIKEEGSLKKADILFLTDGIAPVSQAWLETFKTFKKELQVTVYAVLVHGEGMGAVQQFADHVYHMAELLKDGGKFEDECFSM